MIYFDPLLIAQSAEDEFTGTFEIVRPVAKDGVLARLFNRLFTSLTANHVDHLACEELLLRTTMKLFLHHSSAQATPKGPSPPVAMAIQRLNEAADQQVSLAELAALAGVSRFKLLRGFAREVGTTPHAYLLQRRLRAARRLLAAGQTPVQAAIEAGFADQSHLTRAFVRFFGMTPARYRAAIP
jgi:AraC-like DNA-binding protein